MADDKKKPVPPLKKAPTQKRMSIPGLHKDDVKGAGNMPPAPAKRVGRRRP